MIIWDSAGRWGLTLVLQRIHQERRTRERISRCKATGRRTLGEDALSTQECEAERDFQVTEKHSEPALYIYCSLPAVSTHTKWFELWMLVRNSILKDLCFALHETQLCSSSLSELLGAYVRQARPHDVDNRKLH